MRCRCCNLRLESFDNVDFCKRCIVKARMYQPGFAVYITLDITNPNIRPPHAHL